CCARGDESGEFARKVAVETPAEAEALHVAVPRVERLFRAVVPVVVQYRAKCVAEIGVAGHLHRLPQADRRGVVVALHAAAYGVASVTGVGTGRGDDSFLESDEAVYEFEGGAGRITRHDAPVEERP